jgi:hypothetical protein
MQPTGQAPNHMAPEGVLEIARQQLEFDPDEKQTYGNWAVVVRVFPSRVACLPRHGAG